MTTHPTPELTALVDGALPRERADEVRRHLLACPECAAEERQLRSAVALLGALPAAPEPSPFFGARLEARLREEAARRPAWLERLAALRWRLAVPLAAVAASAALVTVLAVRDARGREREMAEQLELLEDYEAVASLGDVESADDVGVVAHLDELTQEDRR